MTRRLLMIGILLAVAGCAGRSDQSPAEASKKHVHEKKTLKIVHAFEGKHPIKVVCTTGMVADLVRNVGGDRVAVEQLMGAGIDPHLYQATPGDISKIGAADMVVFSGLHLEGKMTGLFEKVGRKVPAVGVAEYVDDVLVDESGVPDPHVWFDCRLWSDAALVVGEALSGYDAGHAREYRERAEKYQKELVTLDQWVKEEVAKVPAKQRVLITSHDAFHYFGRAYGVEVKAIQGISTEAEASVKHINDLVGFISERGIKAVFVESSVNERSMQSLIEGCKARGHEITLGGELFSDAMGPAETPEGTYPGMVRHNVRTFVQALVGKTANTDSPK